MNQVNELIYLLVSRSLWDKRVDESISNQVYEEMNQHAVVALIADLVPIIIIPEENIKKWQ